MNQASWSVLCWLIFSNGAALSCSLGRQRQWYRGMQHGHQFLPGKDAWPWRAQVCGFKGASSVCGRVISLRYWGLQDKWQRHCNCALHRIWQLNRIRSFYYGHQGSCYQSTFRFVKDGQRYSGWVLVASLTGNNELRVFEQRKNNDGGSNWVLEKIWKRLPAPSRGARTTTFATPRRYIVLTPAEETWLFSVELPNDEGRVRAQSEQHPRGWGLPVRAGDEASICECGWVVFILLIMYYGSPWKTIWACFSFSRLFYLYVIWL